jgi:hypothetical protein
MGKYDKMLLVLILNSMALSIYSIQLSERKHFDISSKPSNRVSTSMQIDISTFE